MANRDKRGGDAVRADERELIAQPGYNERVYEIVRRVPEGRVMTYGQIADLLGEGYTPRTVGFVMHAAPEDVPWQRVINAQGACSTQRLMLPHNIQQRLLEAEGVAFDAKGRCDLKRYRWSPDDAPGSAEEDAQASLFS
ncbi:MAG TPA: MGMT family protein [Pyrinomonadaceae bacterium]|jgi:methylated-DNA-protein-cysteine methyltransferase-like protein